MGSQQVQDSLHIIIIGAGLAGLSAAISIKTANPRHSVTILESVRELAEIGVSFLSVSPDLLPGIHCISQDWWQPGWSTTHSKWNPSLQAMGYSWWPSTNGNFPENPHGTSLRWYEGACTLCSFPICDRVPSKDLCYHSSHRSGWYLGKASSLFGSVSFHCRKIIFVCEDPDLPELQVNTLLQIYGPSECYFTNN